VLSGEALEKRLEKFIKRVSLFERDFLWPHTCIPFMQLSTRIRLAHVEYQGDPWLPIGSWFRRRKKERERGRVTSRHEVKALVSHVSCLNFSDSFFILFFNRYSVWLSHVGWLLCEVSETWSQKSKFNELNDRHPDVLYNLCWKSNHLFWVGRDELGLW